MKKLLALFLALSMIFALCACGGSAAPEAPAAPEAEKAAEPAPEAEAAPAAEESKSDEKPINVTLQLTFPEDAAAGVQSIIDALETESNGRLQFDIYYSYSFVDNADVVEALQTNQLDIAGLMPSEYPSLFPLSGTMAYMPMLNFPSWDASSQIYLSTLYANEDMMAEFDSNGLKFWGGYMCPGYQMYINKEVEGTTPDVYNGLTVMCDNAQMQQFINANKGAAISVFPPDFLSNLQNGVADTLMQHVNCAFAFGCFEYVKSAIFFGEGGFCNVPLVFCFSQTFWDSLPEDMQALFAEYADDLCYACHMSDADLYNNVALPTLKENAEIITLTEDEIAVWQEAVQPIIEQGLDDIRADSPNVDEAYGMLKDKIASFDPATFEIGTNNFGIEAVWG